MCISFSVKNTQKFQEIMKYKRYHLCCVKDLQTFFFKMTIEDQIIHQNRKINNQNKPRINLIVDEYNGETRSHDKINEETRKVI